MSTIRQSLFLVLLSQAFMPLASAQTSENQRDYGINLGLDASRTWSDNGATYHQLNAHGTLFFLNEHFHLGPSLSYVRAYDPFHASTNWGVGLTGKWTYENIQATDRTPFVQLAGFITKVEGGDWDSSFTTAEASVGYEMFLNQYVSLAPSVIYRKFWNKSEFDFEDMYVDKTSVDTSARLHLGVNVYL